MSIASPVSIPTATAIEPKTLAELLALSSDQISAVDIARANLLCAEGLPGAEDLDVTRYLKVLDLWTKRIKLQSDRHINAFRRNPEKYRNSEAYWRILAITTTLWYEYNLRYNKDRIEKEDWSHSEDNLIHGLLGPKRTGTCSTLPILVVAIGRRLGYPLYVVHTTGHVFFRWDSDDPKECRNFEFSGDGLSSSQNQFYREWPMKWPEDLIKEEATRGHNRRYLRNLTPTEEVASALANRAATLEAVNRWEESLEAYYAAIHFDPKNPSYVVQRLELMKKISAADELMAGVIATTPNFNPDLPALITAKVEQDEKGTPLTITYKQLSHQILPSDPSFDPTFKPPQGITPALFRIRRVVSDIHSKHCPMWNFKPGKPPENYAY
jgi:hypothetical protein